MRRAARISPVIDNPKCDYVLTAQSDKTGLYSLLRFNEGDLIDVGKLIEILLNTLLPGNVIFRYRLDVFSLSDPGWTAEDKVRAVELPFMASSLHPIDAMDFIISTNYYKDLRHVSISKYPGRITSKLTFRYREADQDRATHLSLLLNNQLQHISEYSLSVRTQSRFLAFRNIRRFLAGIDGGFRIGEELDLSSKPMKFFVLIPQEYYESIRPFMYVAVRLQDYYQLRFLRWLPWRMKYSKISNASPLVVILMTLFSMHISLWNYKSQGFQSSRK